MKRTAIALVAGFVLGVAVTHVILRLLPEGLQGSLEGTLIAWGGALLAAVLVTLVSVPFLANDQG